jgi:hypothetical protein
MMRIPVRFEVVYLLLAAMEDFVGADAVFVDVGVVAIDFEGSGRRGLRRNSERGKEQRSKDEQGAHGSAPGEQF